MNGTIIEVEFSEISSTTVFFVKDEQYVKWNHPGCYLKYNAYCLSTGKYVHFDGDDIVEVYKR